MAESPPVAERRGTIFSPKAVVGPPEQNQCRAWLVSFRSWWILLVEDPGRWAPITIPVRV